LGEGCLSRYDPDDLSAEDGTEFPGAAELWEQLQDCGEGTSPLTTRSCHRRSFKPV
jgi:hypothetical protein